MVVLNVYSPLVHPQLINCQSDGRIPVLLIHGYHSGPEVCDDWLNKFHSDGFMAEGDYFHIDIKMIIVEARKLMLKSLVLL